MNRIAAAAALVALPLGAQAVTIDNFNTTFLPGLSVDGGALGPVTQGPPVAGAIGNTRTYEVENTDANGGVETTINVGFGALNFSNDSNATGNASVLWDANGGGLGGVDLTDGGVNNLFRFDFITADANVDITLEVTDTLANMASFTFSEGTVGDRLISFANFGGVNLASVDSLLLTFDSDGASGTDISVAFLETTIIPLPAPVLMLLGGLGGLGLVARRRRSFAAA